MANTSYYRVMTILLSLLLFWSSLQADETAPTGESASPFDEFFYKPSADDRTKVQKELKCIQAKTDGGQELIKTPQATQMIKRLSPYLQDGFDRFNMGGFERAFFYSQALEESGAFTMLSERKNMEVVGGDAIGNMIVNDSNDKFFKEKKGAKASREFGVYRGRGLVQISGCDNYISTINYLNQVYNQKEPRWNAYWYITENGNRKVITTTCTEAEKDKLINQYAATHQNMNANLYGAFKDPSRLSMIGGEFTDPLSRKKIDSEKLMVDSSLAFWRGKCGETARYAATKASLDTYAPCAPYANADYLSHAVRCLTKCIRGTDSGWERRLKWMKVALLCAQF